MSFHTASDKKEVEKRRAEVEKTTQQNLRDIKDLLSLPAGVRFFCRIFKGVENSSMTGNSYTYFHEGARSYAKAIWQDVVEADSRKAAAIVLMAYVKEEKHG